MESPRPSPSPEEWARLEAKLARTDEDRWISSRYAEGQARRCLAALYAFNVELARVRSVVSEPTLGAIRYQWWRDALEELRAGKPARQHDVVRALADSVDQGAYSLDELTGLIDGHEDAFELSDRSLEPEAALTAVAAGVLDAHHDWGRSIGIIAPAYAALRRGEGIGSVPAPPKAPSAIRPAIAHLRLRRIYGKGRNPGALTKRWVVLRAILGGQV
ncbi:MAG: squalene/phytoene synthase family protein [Pseudomonadota bacterium]